MCSAIVCMKWFSLTPVLSKILTSFLDIPCDMPGEIIEVREFFVHFKNMLICVQLAMLKYVIIHQDFPTLPRKRQRGICLTLPKLGPALLVMTYVSFICLPLHILYKSFVCHAKLMALFVVFQAKVS